MNSPRSQLLVFTVNWCRVSQHRLPPNVTISNGNKKTLSKKCTNRSLSSNFVPSKNFSSTTYYPPDDPFSRRPKPGKHGAAFDELDSMGTWDSGVESASKRSLMEESSLRHGTIIPVIGSDSVGTCCHQGRRAYQEDKFIVAQLGIQEDVIHANVKPLDRKPQNNSTNIMLLAVFDGHGGDDCAHYCQENLQRLLMRNLEQKSGVGSGLSNNTQDPYRNVDLKKALTDTVLELNAAFGRFWENKSLSVVPRPLQTSGSSCTVPHRAFKGANYVTPGSTATIALLRDGYELVVAQLGDSCAFLCRSADDTNLELSRRNRGYETLRDEKKYAMNNERKSVKRLTIDHCASNPEERQRIVDAGGEVTQDEFGSYRVNRRLNMSRSIGDLDLKPYGVTAEPTVIRRSLKHHKDAALVLVTDGITYVMSDEEIAKIVGQCDDPNAAASRLVDQALLHASRDNCTALVLPLGAWNKSKTNGNDGNDTMMHLGRNLALSSRFG